MLTAGIHVGFTTRQQPTGGQLAIAAAKETSVIRSGTSLVPMSGGGGAGFNRPSGGQSSGAMTTRDEQQQQDYIKVVDKNMSKHTIQGEAQPKFDFVIQRYKQFISQQPADRDSKVVGLVPVGMPEICNLQDHSFEELKSSLAVWCITAADFYAPPGL